MAITVTDPHVLVGKLLAAEAQVETLRKAAEQVRDEMTVCRAEIDVDDWIGTLSHALDSSQLESSEQPALDLSQALADRVAIDGEEIIGSVALERVVYPEWRPIETAPKDGVFLAIDRDYEVRRCWRHNPSSRTDEILTWKGKRLFKATHWAPLRGPSEAKARKPYGDTVNGGL